jgi:Domain of unknown function (DUF4345)
MNKKNLQLIMFLLACVPTITGLIGFLGIKDPIYGAISSTKNILLDSNLRFFSGIWLGLGLTLFSIIKTIETQTQIFRIIWMCIFIGGIGRLLSMIFMGMPPLPFVGFTILEIIGAPIFIFWQNKIATKTINQ